MSYSTLSWLEGVSVPSTVRSPSFCLRFRFSRLLVYLCDSIFKEDLFLPDLQDTILMHLTTCLVLSYYNYRLLDYTYIQMCTVLPKVFVNRRESDRLMEEKSPREDFYCFYVSCLVTVSLIQDYENEFACKACGENHICVRYVDRKPEGRNDLRGL